MALTAGNGHPWLVSPSPPPFNHSRVMTSIMFVDVASPFFRMGRHSRALPAASRISRALKRRGRACPGMCND